MAGPTLRSRSASLRIAGVWRAGRDGAYRGPLEYSTGWLTHASDSRRDVVPVSFPVLLKIVYMLTCRVPGLAVLVIRGDHDAQAQASAHASGDSRGSIGGRPSC